MMKISRSECPNWLAENCVKWASQWKAKRENENRGNTWNWYIYHGTAVNQLILPLLIEDTKHHCSYCDKRPVGVETIDHFKPKSKPAFYLNSYDWDNLFVACYDCQVSRWEDYNESLLKPDELEYQFENYFYYDDYSGELFPKGDEHSIEYERANLTIETFKLNERGLPEARRLISNNKETFDTYNIDSIPYRFIFIQ